MKKPMSLARRRFLQLLMSVAAIHVAAIAVYYALDVPTWSPDRQRFYAWSWMGLTVAVVLVGLQRIKRARRQSRGATV